MLPSEMSDVAANADQLGPTRATGAARAGAWSRLTRALVRVVVGRLFRMRIEGELPSRGPYLLVANHQGWVDPFLLVALLPAEPRLYFIADRHAVTHAWWKRLVLRSLGIVVPVARDGTSERGAIEAVLKLLRQGAVVGIFAEGRVSRAESALAPFQRGVGYLAIRAQVPVVPVWLRGTAELYLGRDLLARVGPPSRPPAVEPTKQVTIALANELHAQLSRVALPWVELGGVIKRWRWLTDIL
jgi:1-acyl-sn-glycerol-3-phosphate acyltransferase